MNLAEANPEFEALLDYLKYNRGCDLTGYKRSTLVRRFRYRMQSIQMDTYQNYLRYLQGHPEECHALLNEVLINFTSFFRERDAWAYLATIIIPKIVANKQPDEGIRVWSAGCATGQEIYSLLILLAEALGIKSCLERVQCYATDADEVALQQARKGTYSALEITSISPNLLEKYFEQTEQGYVFHRKLRRTIFFGQHNLTQDAPISQVDLLVCRNVIMYFDREAQTSILARLHLALKNTSFLFLGQAELLTYHREIFTPVHLKHRIYAKGADLALEKLLSITPKSIQKQSTELLTTQSQFRQTAFETSPVAQLAIALNGNLIGANEQAILLFGLTSNGRNGAFRELELGKLLSFHDLITKFDHQRRPVILKNIKRSTSQDTRYFDIAITPVLNSKKQLLSMILTFLDTTPT